MKPEFKKLEKKILMQVLGIIGLALLIGIFIRFTLIDGILEGPFADWFIRICERYLHLDWYEARDVYDHFFRNQKPVLLTVGLLVLQAVIFYFSLFRLTRYFKEVIAGIDRLLDNSDEVIHLSPEMDFMEDKLNSVKQALIQREQEKRAAEQKKNDLVVYLAHDIRTPLTSVIGYLTLLDESCQMQPEQMQPSQVQPEQIQPSQVQPEQVQPAQMQPGQMLSGQQQKYIKTTLENAFRLEELINEFFDITRFNLQTIQLDLDQINLSHMLYQIVDEFYPLFEQKGIVAVVYADEELILTADADKLARVFRNILKNASVFSYRDTAISIYADKMNQDIRIRFCNKGTQIPQQQLETIFEKFYRLDISRSTQTGGAGLGLAIAKEIVSAHGGRIYAESSEEETVFTVILPITLSPS